MTITKNREKCLIVMSKILKVSIPEICCSTIDVSANINGSQDDVE